MAAGIILFGMVIVFLLSLVGLVFAVIWESVNMYVDWRSSRAAAVHFERELRRSIEADNVRSAKSGSGPWLWDRELDG